MGSAPIERLPTELLQPIFFASGHNIALLRASNYIGAQLSDEYVYNSACDHHLTRALGSRAELSIAQTYIFASKWMTWTFFKSWVLRRFGPKGCLCDSSSEDGCFDAQWPPNFNDATAMVFSRSHLPKLSFVTGRIPKKLLRGPWVQDKIQFLRFILWITSMTVDWRDPKAHQIAIEGRKQAMLEKSLEAVELFNHNRRLGKMASLSTVRFAVMEAGCDRSIVYDTLSTANTSSKRSFSCDCAALEDWCEARMEKGDPKGQWLRAKLGELRNFSSQRQTYQGEDSGNICVISSELNPETGDYDGGDEDRLVLNKLVWNQGYRSFGWWCYSNVPEEIFGIHKVSRDELGRFWIYSHGQHHITRGRSEREGPWFRLHMWVPHSSYRGRRTA
ncbi:uncharacterized protein K460DRAFT_87616 [Cucurbitaria berberidis CBS 394.84]|uniref:Uncharacterized protein n=1 Tax=Cucurbitaria berberidis CBS 394.84 TaxID=1168544 RepID=A0A9P4GP99_9PLEO|nr:uncharacterized protein K460DRAFT_87616 [Cucurbitaria berberidis CBS 394.84]KAF1849225.1 hypothetical protein K460DRAFT_87616 [Cucurbitaria berberidis CBS 394.84]